MALSCDVYFKYKNKQDNIVLSKADTATFKEYFKMIIEWGVHYGNIGTVFAKNLVGGPNDACNCQQEYPLHFCTHN